MHAERLGDLGSPAELLRALSSATSQAGLPPPAALTGDWFGARAVIAPSLAVSPVDPDVVFDVTPGSAAVGPAVGGGWFGYLGYPDAGADGQAPQLPAAAGGWSDCVLRCDHDQIWWYESLSGASAAGWLSDALTNPTAPKPWHIDWQAPDREAHRAGVVSCLEAIAAGEVYQACVCTQFTGNLHGDAVDFFADAIADTGPARAAFLAGDWGAVASLSPEVFLIRRGDTVTSSPIKGTLPSSADPSDLRASVKDVAENVMIVDLVRNDLGRVADTGSVTVTELLRVHPAPGVWHLVSTVSARIDPSVPIQAVLDAAFPPASVTGTPKTRARQLLRQWERHHRGVYCGTIGLASPLAGTELNVAIRTAQFDVDGRTTLGVGGGITADSDPDAEWQECLHKAAATVGLRSEGAARSA